MSNQNMLKSKDLLFTLSVLVLSACLLLNARAILSALNNESIMDIA